MGAVAVDVLIDSSLLSADMTAIGLLFVGRHHISTVGVFAPASVSNLACVVKPCSFSSYSHREWVRLGGISAF